MKATNKAYAAFTSKFSTILSKFKDSSTVHVGHEQLKTFFNEYALKQIIVPFVSKMDTSQQLTDRQKKEYTKVYISLADCYKQQILMDQFYEKIMESLSKKSIGVSEVISFICKSLLSRIQDPQNLYPFVSIIINIFRNHPQIPKILKQIIEIIDPNVTSALQEEIITILHDKINNAKVKNEFLDTILAMVLNLQEKLKVQSQIHSFLLKYVKSDDWNCRKTCVDIGNALLIINHEIAQNIHRAIKELKYDKIKHVRESVNNYQILYKQTYGEEDPEKPTKHYRSFRQNNIKPQIDKRGKAKSPAPVSQKYQRPNKEQQAVSPDRSIKGKKMNQNFFKNAKNSDVIKVGQNQSCLVQREKVPRAPEQNLSMHMPQIKKTLQMVSQKANNFEAYLKNRGSPKAKVASPKNMIPPQRETLKKEALNQSQRVEESRMSFDYEGQFQNYKKKGRQPEPESMKGNSYQLQSSSISHHETFVRQGGQTHQILDQFLTYFKDFEKRIYDQLDRLQSRVQVLEKEKMDQVESSRMVRARIISQNLHGQQIKSSPRSFYYNETPLDSHYDSMTSQAIESNIQEKVRLSLLHQNWDEAFTLALTNNKRNILLNLLQKCVFPADKTVQECILLQLKKLLGYSSALKWLKFYLAQKTLSPGRLIKLREELMRRGQGEGKNYEMMKQLVLNQIAEKVDSLN